MDHGIGRLVAALKESGELEHTLIFYLQDNGGCAEGMGRKSNAEQIKDKTYRPFGPNDLQPEIWPPMQTRDGRAVRTGPGVMPGAADTYIAYGRGWANVSNTPFREYKHWVHEGGISTPLIVHWPDGITARGELRQQPGPSRGPDGHMSRRSWSKFSERIRRRQNRAARGSQSCAPHWPTRRWRATQSIGNTKATARSASAIGSSSPKGPKAPWELYDLAARSQRTPRRRFPQSGARPAHVGEMGRVGRTLARRAVAAEKAEAARHPPQKRNNRRSATRTVTRSRHQAACPGTR
jgi:hypothetical protein